MSKIFYIFIFSGFLFLNWSNHVQAANNLDVVINEIAWMGTKASYNDEWVELHNNTGAPINLEGWMLKSTDETLKIALIGIISVNGFYLLERTDDNTVSDTPADKIYTGALKNEGAFLQLIDSQNNIIDEINHIGGWSAGDNTTKTAMERKNPLNSGLDKENWSTNNGQTTNGKDAAGNDILGTPKQQNSVYSSASNTPLPENNNTETNQTTQEENSASASEQTEPQQENPDPQPNQETRQDQPQNQINYPDKIYINEIYPNTLGVDSEEEWVEIYNNSGENTNLENWKLDDEESGSNAFTIPENTIINAKDYLVFYRNKTNITLNNDKDEVRIFWPNGALADSVSYSSAPKGQSYNKINNTWVWSETLTPANQNYKDQSAENNENATSNNANTQENFNQEPIILNQGSGIENQGEAKTSISEMNRLFSVGQNENNNEQNGIQKTTRNLAEINQGFNQKFAKNYFWLVFIIAPLGAFGVLRLKYFLKNR